jgi:hypothetical protein
VRTTISCLLLVTLAACSGEPAPAPQTSEDWIEVPLADNVYRELPAGYRQDTLDVHVPPGPGLEVKLAMKEGAALVYTWHVTDMDEPHLLTSEFHGHTERQPGEPGTVMFYRKGTGGTESGSLIAPFDGIHGWYLRNDSDATVVVRLTVAGFYELTS